MTREKKHPDTPLSPAFDDVLKRMLSTPPNPKKAKPERHDDKKKPAAVSRLA